MYHSHMAKTAVLFRSKYGASKEYALLLGKRLNAEVIENEGLIPKLVEEFDAMVLIGGVYAGRISGIEFWKKHFDDFSDKRLAVFAVGAAPDSPDNIETLRKHNLKGRMDRLPLFYGRGSFDESALTFMDKNLLNLVRKSAQKAKPEKRSPLDNVLLEVSEAVSWVDESYLDQVIDCMLSI